jgi:hypothetical protein
MNIEVRSLSSSIYPTALCEWPLLRTISQRYFYLDVNLTATSDLKKQIGLFSEMLPWDLITLVCSFWRFPQKMIPVHAAGIISGPCVEKHGSWPPIGFGQKSRPTQPSDRHQRCPRLSPGLTAARRLSGLTCIFLTDLQAPKFFCLRRIERNTGRTNESLLGKLRLPLLRRKHHSGSHYWEISGT